MSELYIHNVSDGQPPKVEPDAKHVFIYSGSEVPKPLRPPKDGELHVWLDQGRKFVLTNGTWVEWADAEADGPSLPN